jgi:hypothetical protein
MSDETEEAPSLTTEQLRRIEGELFRILRATERMPRELVVLFILPDAVTMYLEVMGGADSENARMVAQHLVGPEGIAQVFDRSRYLAALTKEDIREELDEKIATLESHETLIAIVGSSHVWISVITGNWYPNATRK